MDRVVECSVISPIAVPLARCIDPPTTNSGILIELYVTY